MAPGGIAFLPATLAPVTRRQFVWVDRTGAAEALPIAADAFETPRLSPSGDTIAASVRDVVSDVWTLDVARGARARVSMTAPVNDTPIWTPDGRVAYRVPLASGGRSAVVVVPLGKTELEAERLWDGPASVQLGGWSGASGVLAGTRGGDLWMLNPTGIGSAASDAATQSLRDRWVSTVIETSAIEEGVALSPEGRWLAYSSNTTGRWEIFLQPLAGGAADRRQISVDGGREAVWSRDGRELFFRQGDAVLAVGVSAGVPAGAPRVLFRGAYVSTGGPAQFDVSPDGRRFLMLRDDAGRAAAPMVLSIRSLPAPFSGW